MSREPTIPGADISQADRGMVTFAIEEINADTPVLIVKGERSEVLPIPLWEMHNQSFEDYALSSRTGPRVPWRDVLGWQEKAGGWTSRPLERERR